MKTKNNDVIQGLEEFTWDNPGENFFDSPSEKEEVEQTAPVVEKPADVEEEEEEDTSSKEKKVEKPLKEEKEKEESFFTETVEDVKTSGSLKSTVKNFVDKGLFTSLTDEDFDSIDSDEDVETLVEKELENRLAERMQEFVEDLDEDAKDFIKFKRNGGKTVDYFETLDTSVFLDDLTKEDLIVDENIQKEFLIGYYTQFEELGDDEIKDKIEFLEERGRLSATAERFFDRLSKKKEKEKAELLKKTEDARINAKKNALKYQEELKKTLQEIDVVGKLKITKKDKKELYGYCMNPSLKREDGSKTTPFQDDLSKVFKDKKLLIALAKIIRDDFNINETEITTGVVRDIKKNLRKGSETIKRSSLTDYF